MVWYNSKGKEPKKQVEERLLEPFEVGIPCSLQQTFKEQGDGEPIHGKLQPGGIRPSCERTQKEVREHREKVGTKGVELPKEGIQGRRLMNQEG